MAWLEEPKERTWVTGDRPIIEGTLRYVICIRSPDDPERRPRPEGGQEDKAPHLTIKKWGIQKISGAIMGLLKDGKARTFNGIGIELWDKSANILSETKVEEAIWQLVEHKRLEFTMEAPVLFRRRRLKCLRSLAKT